MPDELWDRIRRLEDEIVVNARLANRLEQKVDVLEQQAKEQRQVIAELSAGLSGLVETVDRFIQGREGNGRENRGISIRFQMVSIEW